MSVIAKLRALPEYTRNLGVAEAASLLTPMRRGIAVYCWTYGLGVLLLTLSPAGPTSTWAEVVMIVVGAVSLVLGVLWWFGDWPTAAVSLTFLVYADLAHSGVLLLTSSPMLALIATLWFVLMGEHLTIAHGRVAVITHCFWALLNIVFFGILAWPRSNANHTLIIYVGIVLIGVIVAMPIFRQLTTDALRDDSRRATALAERDALTSLLNQRGLYAAVPGLIADGATTDRLLAVVVIDLDRFKSVNDRFGHHRGDQVLVLTAERLRSTVRRNAVVARTGGEEFVVIDTVSVDGGEALARRLLGAIHRPEDDLPITASVGVATVPLGAMPINTVTQSVEALTSQADRAMYSAKRAGGNRIFVDGAPTPS